MFSLFQQNFNSLIQEGTLFNQKTFNQYLVSFPNTPFKKQNENSSPKTFFVVEIFIISHNNSTPSYNLFIQPDCLTIETCYNLVKRYLNDMKFLLTSINTNPEKSFIKIHKITD